MWRRNLRQLIAGCSWVSTLHNYYKLWWFKSLKIILYTKRKTYLLIETSVQPIPFTLMKILNVKICVSAYPNVWVTCKTCNIIRKKLVVVTKSHQLISYSIWLNKLTRTHSYSLLRTLINEISLFLTVWW